MQFPLVLAACLAALIALGACERIARDRARRAVPIRIHVNGTRGKSAVARLIAGALREAGIPTIAKTTGTAARVLLPDGGERPVGRRAPPTIREQLWLLRAARRAGARAIVAECMAIQPELQWVSEREMLSSTIGVITNVRLDHAEAMGVSLDQIAESLANTTPAKGTLVVGDRRFLPVFERRAARLGTTVVVAESEVEPGGAETPWETSNRAVALAVTRILGIPDRIALEGMMKARSDPGAISVGSFRAGTREMRLVDATAANDPESLEMVMAGLLQNEPPVGAGIGAAGQPDLSSWVAVYNNRADRELRLRAFAEASSFVQRAGRVILTGDRPSFTSLSRLRRARGALPVTFCGRRRLAGALAQIATDRIAPAGLVFCGNAKGLDVRTFAGQPRHTVSHG